MDEPHSSRVLMRRVVQGPHSNTVTPPLPVLPSRSHLSRGGSKHRVTCPLALLPTASVWLLGRGGGAYTLDLASYWTPHPRVVGNCRNCSQFWTGFSWIEPYDISETIFRSFHLLPQNSPSYSLLFIVSSHILSNVKT